MVFRAFVLTVGVLLASPGFAQAPPKTMADCQKLYDAELKKAVAATQRNLRESQHRAGIAKLRCERAVERKIFQDKAKQKR
ncbi:MAG: hypothetical protein C6Y20_17550 [Tagaea sp. CACIAM 22H2]|nr:hypothetical protein [Tagaea sp. CACIAM 22H2]